MSSDRTGYRLRPATEADLPGLYAVCLKTGDSGKDGTALHDDPTLLGTFFVGPYVVLEPDLAFTLEGPAGAAGYLLGALDTPAFNRRFEAEWLVPLRRAVRDPGADPAAWRQSDWVRRLIHEPGLVFPPVLLPYPAHAHIDLLPEAHSRDVVHAPLRLAERVVAEDPPGVPGAVAPCGGERVALDGHARRRDVGVLEVQPAA